MVWIIDDCPISMRIVRSRLKSFGAEPIEFATGTAAVNEWTAGSQPRPACILLDPNMHDQSVLDTARLLREAGYTGGLVLHISSASAAATPSLEQVAIDGVVLKPATARGLRIAIEDAIAAHRRSA